MPPASPRALAHPSGEHDVEPAGGAELPAAELGRPFRVEREAGEPLEQFLDGDLDERAARVVPGSAHPAAAGALAPGGRPVSGRGYRVHLELH